MQEFDNIKDMIYCEIDDISHQGKLDMNTVKVLSELVDILKDVGSIEMFEEGINIQDDDYNYSRGYSQRRMPVYYNDNGNSYGYRNNRNSGYSRRGRSEYSRESSKDHMINKLHELMMEANNQSDKDSIQRLIDQMESNK